MKEQQIDEIKWTFVREKEEIPRGRCHVTYHRLYRSLNTSPSLYRMDEERRWYVGSHERSITESTYQKVHGGRMFERKDIPLMEISLMSNTICRKKTK